MPFAFVSDIFISQVFYTFPSSELNALFFFCFVSNIIRSHHTYYVCTVLERINYSTVRNTTFSLLRHDQLYIREADNVVA
jgi:hypothetical protein